MNAEQIKEVKFNVSEYNLVKGVDILEFNDMLDSKEYFSNRAKFLGSISTVRKFDVTLKLKQIIMFKNNTKEETVLRKVRILVE